MVIVVSYAMRGSTGFGAAAAMPLLALVIPLKVLVPAWTLLGITASATLVSRDRAFIAWGEIVRLAPPCVAGVLIGLYVFTALDAHTLTRGLGIVVLLYGFYSLWQALCPAKPMPMPPRAVAAPVAGVIAGAVGTTFGTMASVFFAMYFHAIRMGKDAFRATMSAILFMLVITRGAGYFLVGEFTSDALITFLIALPLMLLGIFIGNHIHARISDLGFKLMVSGALIVSGAGLLWK